MTMLCVGQYLNKHNFASRMLGEGLSQHRAEFVGQRYFAMDCLQVSNGIIAALSGYILKFVQNTTGTHVSQIICASHRVRRVAFGASYNIEVSRAAHETITGSHV